jgi:hypothetical protein
VSVFLDVQLVSNQGALTTNAGSAPLVTLVDVDSLCSELNGRIGAELIDTLRMLEASDSQIVLVSTRAQELAAFMNTRFDRAWWCDRNIGWHDRGRENRSNSPTPFAAVLTELRRRVPGASVLALSNDGELCDAVDVQDRVIRFGTSAADDIIKAIWTLIDMRTSGHRRYKR